MENGVKNILGLVAGLLLGSLANMAIVIISGSIIPPPIGTDVSTLEGLKEAIKVFEPKHFTLPFLAHAVGSLVGGMVVANIAPSNQIKYALVIGGIFLLGGIDNVLNFQYPLWFSILDLSCAYIVMAWLGAFIVLKKSK